MKISLIITLRNEEKSINKLLRSIKEQKRLPNELVIVDAGSTDRTIDLIHASKIEKFIKTHIYNKPNLNIAKGRNIAISKSKYEIIAVTDGGCALDKNWLLVLEETMQINNVSVVFGNSKAKGISFIGKCFALFHEKKTTGSNLTPTEFSSRSLLLTKQAWKRVKGYPEWLTLAGEDTLFFIELQKKTSYSYAPKAITYWYHGNETHRKVYKMHRRNSIGSGEASMATDRYLLLIAIYFLGLLTILFSFKNILLLFILILAGILFLSRGSLYVYKKIHNKKVFLIMPIILFYRDMGMISGYVRGNFNKVTTKIS